MRAPGRFASQVLRMVARLIPSSEEAEEEMLLIPEKDWAMTTFYVSGRETHVSAPETCVSAPETYVLRPET
ncbi:MAG: hypothetical protein K5896_08630 [Prevotella sp.]|nr:hypothetical protein [Prevotella sp.]